MKSFSSPLADRPNLKRLVTNFSYFFSEKVIRIVVGFVLQTWLARHLGPEGMGVYSYVADFTTVFIPLVLFGLDDFLVKDLVRTEDHGKVLGTVFLFRIVLGTIGWAALVVAIYAVRRESPEVFWFTVAYGTLIIFRSFDTFSSYFHSQYMIRPLIQGRQSVYLLASFVRGVGLWMNLHLGFFILNTWVQMVFEKVVAYFQMRRLKEIRLTFDFDYLKKILPSALPIALTGFFTYAETRLGTFFLNRFETIKAVGEFGVGRGLLDLWEFIPVSICLTVFPAIVTAKDKDQSTYHEKLRNLYAVQFYLGLAFALSVTISADQVIHALYGERYTETIRVLTYGSWLAILTYLNLARVKWYILENKTIVWLSFCFTTFSLNFALQFYFTENYGIIGPYISSITAQLAGNLIIALFNKSMREDIKNIAWGMVVPFTYFLSPRVETFAKVQSKPGRRIFLLSDGKNPHTIKWARGLASEGFEIFIYSLSVFDPSIYKAYPNIQCAHAGFDEKLNKSGDGALIKIAYLRILNDLKEKIEEFGPHILHAHFSSSYGLLGALTKFKPFFISVWGADVYDFPKRSFLHRKVLEYNLKKADRIFSTSNVMAKETQKYTGKDIEVIPFGVDLEKFKPNENQENLFPKESLVIGTIKSLEDKYGINVLLDAFVILRARYADLPLKLLIVGRGTKETELKAQAERLGIATDTVFTGFIPVEDVPMYQNMLDIAVFPSVLDSESFGVAVIEANACGKPVIVSNKGGLPEVVEHGESGFVVPANDPKALADAIGKLIQDPQLRTSVGLKGRERIKRLYDWKLNLISMIKAYEKEL